MKRTIALIAMLTVLICSLIPAYAAGNIQITEETWYAPSHSGDGAAPERLPKIQCVAPGR